MCSTPPRLISIDPSARPEPLSVTCTVRSVGSPDDEALEGELGRFRVVAQRHRHRRRGLGLVPSGVAASQRQGPHARRRNPNAEASDAGSGLLAATAVPASGGAQLVAGRHDRCAIDLRRVRPRDDEVVAVRARAAAIPGHPLRRRRPGLADCCRSGPSPRPSSRCCRRCPEPAPQAPACPRGSGYSPRRLPCRVRDAHSRRRPPCSPCPFVTTFAGLIDLSPQIGREEGSCAVPDSVSGGRTFERTPSVTAAQRSARARGAGWQTLELPAGEAAA
jgi:hypothetical protein